MKIRHLCTAALLLLSCPAPARADIHLDLAGYARVYMVYADNDEQSTAAPGDSLHHFGLQRYSGFVFTGERTLDSGLTVGVKSEMKFANESSDDGATSLTSGAKDPNQFDHAFIYFSGSFGRVNLGANEGAAHLLGVAAPSADSNVDGMRVYVQGWNADTWDDGISNASLSAATTFVRLSYDNSDFGKVDRITYLTPKWNGFQAGASYAPENSQNAVDDAFAGMSPDDRPGKFENLFDASARWDTKFGDVKLAVGAGFTTAATELDAAVGANGSDSIHTWDAGINLGWKEWSAGSAYKHSDTGVAGGNNDLNLWVVGLAWDKKPWHVGASFYDLTFDANAFSIGLADRLELQRSTVGFGYTYAPGMSFRGSATLLDVDNGINAALDPHQTQVVFGTDMLF